MTKDSAEIYYLLSELLTYKKWQKSLQESTISESAFEFTPTLLVNKFSWSYHKVALDLWGSRIWLNVSIFYQFHKAKSRYLSSEPGHWFKKQLSKFSWNQSKDLTFAQIFAFCDLNVIFDNSNWIECVYILKFQIGVNSKAGHYLTFTPITQFETYIFLESEWK